MTITVEALLVASLMMAVFAAVATVGSSLFLGAGYERLSASLERVKKQTLFFSKSLDDIEGRVDGVEKQGQYFFEAIHKLETASPHPQEPMVHKDASEDVQTTAQEMPPKERYLVAAKNDAGESRADILLQNSEDKNRISFH